MTHEQSSATREISRVALVTCDLFPDLYEDEFPLRNALRARGVTVDSPLWDDPAVDWPAYDLVIPRSTWDYPARHDEFLAWARQVPRLANPAEVIEWNTDKHYLRELAAAGVPGHPHHLRRARRDLAARQRGGVGGQAGHQRRQQGHRAVRAARRGGTGPRARRPPARGRAHRAGAALSGRRDQAGETALLYTPGADGELGFSHAIRKGPLLTGPDLGNKEAEYAEDISARTPADAELAVGERVVAALPGGLLYARVDLIPGPDGAPMLVEVELTEPSLFWTYAEGSAERMADAIVARLSSV